MSTPINDGGPAFPQAGASIQVKDGVYFLDKGGMTLRDWFGGQALAGMLANPSLVRWSDDPANNLRPSLDVYDQRATLAFKATQIADAMLAAREGKQ